MSIDKEKILDQISSMSLIDLIDLIDRIEKKFGINSNEYMFNSSKDKEIKVVEEKKDNFSLFLDFIGNNKIAVIKIIRNFLNLGLKEAKDLVESVPVLIKENVSKKNIDILKKSLEDVGAKISIK